MKQVKCYDCGKDIQVKDMARTEKNWVCIDCSEIRKEKRWKSYHLRHPGRACENAKKRYRQGPDKFKQRAVTYLHSKSDEERETNRAYIREYHRVTREIRMEYKRERIANNPQLKIARTCRARQATLIKEGLLLKTCNTEKLLGCKWEELKAHLEKLFLLGMSWGNYGEDWHIDHIIPISSFNLLDDEEKLKCFHYTNLQPLWAKDNLSKGAKISDASSRSRTHHP